MVYTAIVRSLVVASLVAFCVRAGAQEAAVAGVLHATSFSSLADGDFPADLSFRGGGMQIDHSQGDAMLRLQGSSWFHIELPAALPENFAIEFDYYTSEAYAVLFVSAFDASLGGQSAPSYSGYRQGQFNFFSLANTVVGVAVDSASESLPKANAQNAAFTQSVVPVRLEVRGRQARIFVGGEQALIHPAASLLRTDTVEFFYGGIGSPGFGYLGDIRILSL